MKFQVSIFLNYPLPPEVDMHEGVRTVEDVVNWALESDGLSAFVDGMEVQVLPEDGEG